MKAYSYENSERGMGGIHLSMKMARQGTSTLSGNERYVIKHGISGSYIHLHLSPKLHIHSSVNNAQEEHKDSEAQEIRHRVKVFTCSTTQR